MSDSKNVGVDVGLSVERYLNKNGFDCFEPKAALIDMDGTLLDSMPSHAKAWHRMMSELGVDCCIDEFFLYEGMTGAASINILFKRAFGREATPEESVELYRRKTCYFNEMPRVGIIKGADRMLRAFMDHGLTRVLVTGSGQASNLVRLDNDFPGAFLPELRITSADVSKGKPDPEPYLKAMTLARVQPWQSVVVENAPLGVRAGVAAGAFTVAVLTGPVPAGEMVAAGADLILPSMERFADMLESGEFPL